MVYCGKPSKSCRQCRERDIKCDKRLGSCGQCTRAHLVCPGYPDPNNVIFRDETRRVVRKNGRERSQQLKAQQLLAFTTQSTSLGSANARTPDFRSTECVDLSKLAIPFPILPSIGERAKSFFICTQANSPLVGVPSFSTLRSFTISTTIGPHLLAAVRAVCLAFYSKSHNFCSTIMQTARLEYTAALKYTQVMLQDPQTARKNSTLVAVLYLYMFEKLVGCYRGIRGGEADMCQEARHLNGAMALVQFRGENQFSDEICSSVFKQLRFGILTVCLESGSCPPAQFVAAREMAAKRHDTPDMVWRYEDVVIRLASLQASRKNGMIDCEGVTSIANELDYECLELRYLVQASHSISTEADGAQGADSSASKCRLLNQLSIIRLILAEITSSPISQSRSDMAALCEAIYISAAKQTSCASSESQVFLFSLYTAARSSHCPASIKTQITTMITRQQEPYASKIVRLLEEGESPTNCWSKTSPGNPWAEFSRAGLGDLNMLGV